MRRSAAREASASPIIKIIRPDWSFQSAHFYAGGASGVGTFYALKIETSSGAAKRTLEFFAGVMS